MLFLAILLTLVTAAHVAYPMEIFEMQHWCSVRNPEPSDFYLATLPVAWGLFTLLTLVCYIAALRAFP